MPRRPAAARAACCRSTSSGAPRRRAGGRGMTRRSDALMLTSSAALRGPAPASRATARRLARRRRRRTATGGARSWSCRSRTPRDEPRLHWLGEASAVLLADELNARGVSARSRATSACARSRSCTCRSRRSLSRATVIKVGAARRRRRGRSSARSVLDGDDADASTAHSIRLDAGRLQPEVTERGQLDRSVRPLRAARAAARAARRRADPPRALRPPLDAFENYVKGLLAESPAAQATFLEAALRDPRRSIARGWRCGTSGPTQGDHAAALAAARAVPAELAARSHARVSSPAMSLLELKRYDEAFETFKALVASRRRRRSAAPTPAPCSTISASSSSAAARRRRPARRRTT